MVGLGVIHLYLIQHTLHTAFTSNELTRKLFKKFNDSHRMPTDFPRKKKGLASCELDFYGRAPSILFRFFLRIVELFE